MRPQEADGRGQTSGKQNVNIHDVPEIAFFPSAVSQEVEQNLAVQTADLGRANPPLRHVRNCCLGSQSVSQSVSLLCSRSFVTSSSPMAISAASSQTGKERRDNGRERWEEETDGQRETAHALPARARLVAVGRSVCVCST